MTIGRLRMCGIIVAIAIGFWPALPSAQETDAPQNEEDQGAAGAPVVPDVPVVPEAPPQGGTPPEAAPPETPPQQQIGDVERGFQYRKTPDTTYTATAPLRGLSCVVGVGSQSACAVTFPKADEDGYPWTLVKCRPGDVSLRTFATLISNKQPVDIFEAPPQLTTKAQTRSIDVNLVRVCRKPAAAVKR